MIAGTAAGGGDPGRPLRLAILVSHSIQYFVPLFRGLAGREGVELTVIYRTRVGLEDAFDPGFGRTVQWDIPFVDGYQAGFLSNKTHLSGFDPRVFPELRRGRFDALVVHGYDSPTNLAAIALARLAGCPVLMRRDTRLLAAHLQAPPWRARFKRWLFRHVDGFLAIGSLNRDYYLALGADPGRVFYVPFGVDNHAFGMNPDWQAAARARIRSDLGVAEGTALVLYAAKLTPQKCPGDLIRAFAQARGNCPGLGLVLVGSGGLEGILRAQVAAVGVGGIHWLGFRNQSELPALLAAADLFVLPSRDESWGLAVNEAMAAGLPVIVSDKVGAAADLVDGHGTGVIYSCGDIDALARALVSLGTSVSLRESMGARGRALIQGWGPAQGADAMIAAARAVAGMPGPAPWRLGEVGQELR